MLTEDVPPQPQLMESLRAVGYTLETAIADLVDNSIAAKAAHVRISFGSMPAPYVAILDDGWGMTHAEARHAMRLAGNSAIESRAATDLGRFGLGLKTASLSQCREVTLVSKKDGHIVALRWDLEHLAVSGKWSLLVLEDTEIDELPNIDEIHTLDSGTLVLWRKLDRMTNPLENLSRALDAQMSAVAAHLSLVFHRYLSAEHGRPFGISVNGVALRKSDPFMKDHVATQVGPLEYFSIEGERVELRSYTLPFLNKLTHRELERAQVAGKLRESQGFYIYRAMRLVIWGTWFRIVPKNELGKLARVKVDIPNTLDHLWALDIKKSAALPPARIRNELRRVVDKIVGPSRSAHVYRGRVEPQVDTILRTWNLVRDRGTFRYEINRDHPFVATLAGRLDQVGLTEFRRVLALLETSYPVEDVYNRLAEDETLEVVGTEEDSLTDLARAVWGVRRLEGVDPEDFVRDFSHTEPFNKSRDPESMLRKATQS